MYSFARRVTLLQNNTEAVNVSGSVDRRHLTGWLHLFDMEVFLFSPLRVNDFQKGNTQKNKQKQNRNNPPLLVELGIFHPVVSKNPKIMTENTSKVNSVKCFAINIL